MSAEKQSTPSKDGATPATPAAAAPPKTEAIPDDPDEDDLDELDDVLDEFSESKAKAAPAAGLAAAAAGSGKAPAKEPGGGAGGAAAAGGGAPPEDFDEQLAQEMAKLMGGVDSDPDMQKQLQEMMREIDSVVQQQMKQGDASAGEELPPSSSASKGTTKAGDAGASSASAASAEDTFAETIRKTMERMQASGDKATAEASADTSDDFLAEMLKQMQGGGSDEDFSKMLLGMMEQLTNKEILYEPMRELKDKFPEWMERNKDKTPAADLARYTEQQKLVKDIVARFEKPGYSDENSEDREYIVEKMQQMQAQGSPPNDLVGDMEDAQKSLGDLESGCAQQ